MSWILSGIRTDLEKENGRLKRLVADLSFDNAILKRGAGSYCTRCAVCRKVPMAPALKTRSIGSSERNSSDDEQ